VYGDALAAVPEGDHRAFAEAVCGLLADPLRQARLAERGRACAAQYDWDAIACDDGSAAGLR
jgi:glycosyltransferase involved in cell wall biosynthesis